MPVRERERSDVPVRLRVPDPDVGMFVPLPQRTTHGGPFGPKVRAKLIAEILGKR